MVESAVESVILVGIELAALDLTEESIKCIVATLASLVVIRSLRRGGVVVGYRPIPRVLACLLGSH